MKQFLKKHRNYIGRIVGCLSFCGIILLPSLISYLCWLGVFVSLGVICEPELPQHKMLVEYLKVKFPVRVREIKNNEGGGYVADIPVLGAYAYQGDGETPEEAICHLNQVKKMLFELCLRKEPKQFEQRMKEIIKVVEENNVV